MILHHHRLNHCPSANYSAAIRPAVFYEYVRTATDDGSPPEQMFHDWSAEVRACGVRAAAAKARAVAAAAATTTATRM